MSHLSILILAATLGQLPAESGWLDSVPPDADVVLRVRGLDAAKDDLVTMLKAMSPSLAAQAEPTLEHGLAMVKTQVSQQAADGPFFILFRGVTTEGPATPPFAVILKSTNYEALLKSISGGKDPEIKRLEAGFDSFKGPDGQTWFAAKGDGTVAFGGDKILVGGYSKPSHKALGKTLSPGLRKKFLGGDIGVFVNVGALTARYKEPLAQAEQALLDSFDKLGPALDSGMIGFIKSIYGKMFDSIRQADVLAYHYDFSGEGLGISGVLTVKADSKASKAIAGIETGDATRLEKLPSESSYYAYMKVDASFFQSIQLMSLQMLAPGSKVSPEIESAIAKEHGQIETIGAISIGDGIKSFQVTNLANPKDYVTAYEATIRLMQKADNSLNFYKEIKSTPDAENDRGFSFTRIEMTLDYEKFAKIQPNNPGLVGSMKAMYPGDKITTWIGFSDSQMIQIVAPTWTDAKAKIDGYYSGDKGIGATAGYKATRSRLAKKASFLALMSAQGFVRQFTAQLSLTMPGAPEQVPVDMPKEPALIGFALCPAAPNAIEFQWIVPSTVGPVFEKGLMPVLNRLRPNGKP
jgi:hypothetical protein